MYKSRIPKDYKGPKVIRGDMDKFKAFLREIKKKKRTVDENLEEKMRSFGMID